MSQRIDYMQQSPEFFKKFLQFSLSLKGGSIDPTLQNLVNIRVSQVNGCGFCLDMHVKEAKLAGERELRLYHVAIWRESPLFDAREKAALDWAELLTQLPPHGIPDADFARVRVVLSDKEMSDLSYIVMAINAWNRLNIGFVNIPGSRDAELGLDKAGLH